MSNPRLTPQHRQHPAVANSAGHQVVAHKSTGGTLTSIPQPVDPVGNASPHLTNNTVALPWSKGSGHQTHLEALSVPSPFMCKGEGFMFSENVRVNGSVKMSA
jgi:hypothetical protein